METIRKSAKERLCRRLRENTENPLVCGAAADLIEVQHVLLADNLLNAATAEENFIERWKAAYLEVSEYEHAEELFEDVRKRYHDA